MKELRRQLKELLQQAGADAEVLEAFSQKNAVFQRLCSTIRALFWMLRMRSALAWSRRRLTRSRQLKC